MSQHKFTLKCLIINNLNVGRKKFDKRRKYLYSYLYFQETIVAVYSVEFVRPTWPDIQIDVKVQHGSNSIEMIILYVQEVVTHFI